ncbi:MAG: NTP transferase domain-containing protein [Bacteroidetes bacterium]|nr:NTP transferase domain-containing protein [Bacteroidota bacterium]MBL6943307.1 NTP transferase domain-containing protein [Bacteroidales bacterium]
MKRPKFLLSTTDGNSFIEKIIHQYADFGCSNIIVMLNSEGIALIKKHTQNLPIQTQIVLNPYPDLGRFFSIKTGLKFVHNYYTFIHNVDNPFANKKVLEQLYSAKTEAKVIKPVYNNNGGHPVLISPTVCDYILNEKKHDVNFKEILNRFSTKKVEVKDETILLNINTYDEYLEFY